MPRSSPGGPQDGAAPQHSAAAGPAQRPRLLLLDRPASTAVPSCCTFPAAASLRLRKRPGETRFTSYILHSERLLQGPGRSHHLPSPSPPLFTPKCGTCDTAVNSCFRRDDKLSPISHSLFDPSSACYPNDRSFIHLLRVLWTGRSPCPLAGPVTGRLGLPRPSSMQPATTPASREGECWNRSWCLVHWGHIALSRAHFP